MKKNEQQIIDKAVSQDYKYGFVTDVEQEILPPGLDEDVIRFISEKKNEPAWLLEYRLKAFRHWETLDEPQWALVNYPEIDFQSISYYAAPKTKKKLASLDEVDPELLSAYEKLGIPLDEQKRWLAWTGTKQEMLDMKDDENIWNITEDNYANLKYPPENDL